MTVLVTAIAGATSVMSTAAVAVSVALAPEASVIVPVTVSLCVVPPWPVDVPGEAAAVGVLAADLSRCMRRAGRRSWQSEVVQLCGPREIRVEVAEHVVVEQVSVTGASVLLTTSMVNLTAPPGSSRTFGSAVLETSAQIPSSSFVNVHVTESPLRS